MSQQNLNFVSFLSAFLLLILFRPTAAGAVLVRLDGTRTVLIGEDCAVATYRFGSSTIYNGQEIDLLVEVLPGEDNDRLNSCVIYSGNSITTYLKDADQNDDFAFMDLKITVVKKGTTTPLEVDRLAVSGFDLDSDPPSSGTDDIYFKNPDGTYITANSKVTASTGSFFGQYQTKLKGRSTGNCTDGPTGGIDVTCRGAAIFIKGANGSNTVSSVTLRIQNDNAYGTSASGTRIFQLSFDFSYIDQLILNTQDYGDAASSYGTAGATISTARSLGYGILPDSETTNQFSATANGDDIDGSTIAGKFDDEDGVRANNLPLDNQTFFTNTATNLSVTTFGPGYLSAWLDFNKDGDFLDVGEKVLSDLQITNTSVLTSTVPLNIPRIVTAGNTAMRFRFSAATGVGATGLTSTGEVEDYQIAIAQPIASDPNLLLVKRITAINPDQSDAIQFNNFIDDNGTTNDNNLQWPDSDSNPGNNINNYLRGAVSFPQIKPGDEVEYTIYFLSNGDVAAKNIQICDVVPDNMTFNKNSYGTEFGMSLALNSTTLPSIPNKNLSNLIDTDEGSFYAPGTNPLINLCKKHDPNNPNNLISVDSSNNLSGAVLINLSTPLPPATAPGTPPDSYGFVRFRAKVK